ncbi:MAG: hydroxymethylbilane synthase [Pseudomonadota bacterium]|nr:hydroxymethylbilane synthase [Pseudomonadota bacterium]
MANQRTLKLGTRPSALAIAQSRVVVGLLKNKHPEINIELIPIKTRGDINTKTPLTDVKDPVFFTAELDQALIDGDIDFCVHSFKDLPIIRPNQIQLASTPKRENPADIVLFQKDIEDKLHTKEVIKIGSSSLRRKQNTNDFLLSALPKLKEGHALDFVPLRGNILDRLKKIINRDKNSLDAVVIALAGLQRLWLDPESHHSIKEALTLSRMMVLPISECPTAPGQGALAIECRKKDQSTLNILETIHDLKTEQLLIIEKELVKEVSDEYAIEASALGSTAIENEELGFVARLRGRSTKNSNTVIYRCRTALMPKKPHDAKPWSKFPKMAQERKPLQKKIPNHGINFIAHWHAMEFQEINPDVRYWTSGTESWIKLARQGFWIEACTDHLGFNSIKDWLSCDALQLPKLKEWKAITHFDAVKSWDNSKVGNIIATYRIITNKFNDNTSHIDQLKKSTHFYWKSPQHFDSLRHLLPNNAHHACGPGKTIHAIRSAGIKNVTAFPSYREWQNWLN